MDRYSGTKATSYLKPASPYIFGPDRFDLDRGRDRCFSQVRLQTGIAIGVSFPPALIVAAGEVID
jgi:hypothetical protein